MVCDRVLRRCPKGASFSVSIYKDKRIKGRVGWVVKPSFQISLHTRDMKLLLQIQEFFTCGNIVSKNNRSEASFRVNSLHDLINFIIPRGAARPLAKAASRCLQPGLKKIIISYL